MFEGLTEKLNNAFKAFRGKGKLSESDVKAGMREGKLALEAVRAWRQAAAERRCSPHWNSSARR